MILCMNKYEYFKYFILTNKVILGYTIDNNYYLGDIVMSEISENRPVINNDLVETMSQRLIDERSLMSLADFFKLFSDESRLKILYLLTMNEMCVSDIAATLGMNQSTVSHQLKTLRNSRIVKYRREAKVVYYSLDDDHIGQILLQGMLHVSDFE